jgi:DNA-binding NtrC family response regulator
MRAADLRFRELLEEEDGGSRLSLGGRRVVVLDAVALGHLRRELIGTVGLEAARGIITRIGVAHAWALAEELRHRFQWDSEREWRIAGAHFGQLQGWTRIEPIHRDPKVERVPLGEALWFDSYEAEQHKIHCGISDEPVCWAMAGFASGYMSYCHGRTAYVLEKHCAAQGHANCHVVVDFEEDWGEELHPHKRYFTGEGIDETLARATKELRAIESKLRRRRQQLAGVAPRSQHSASEAMRRVLELVGRAARVDSTVLISGESGVGKERIATLLHEQSARAGKPFVAINCAAITETLLESELFGHVRGAFTGASHDRAGLFEAAAGGTLFLDEVGEMPLGTQVKLLRVLQERQVRPVGASATRPVDVRVVAATNRVLRDDVESGRFRKDLCYRLRVIEIHVPPLRQRREEILALARSFVAIAAARMRAPVEGMTSAAADRILAYPWPGNVRELENAIERAVALSAGTRIDVDDLPPEVRGGGQEALVSTAAPIPLALVERQHILATLARNRGNRTQTARDLAIAPATLWRRLAEYEKSDPGTVPGAPATSRSGARR